MALLIGELDQTIDAKHRLAISSAFRDLIDPEQDGKDFFLVLGPDRHLWLYPDRYYRRLLAGLKRSPLPNRHQRKIDLLFAMARLLKPDAQGRVVLPEKSMRRAVVAQKVTLVGVKDHIEIWPTDEWNRRVDQELSQYGEMLYEAADRLENSDARDVGSA
jgi:MraZ protein